MTAPVRAMSSPARVGLVAARGELVTIARPVDPSDRVRFPEIAAACDHLASLSPEHRARVEREWEGL